MRGKGLQGHQARCRHGITPAYAGKSSLQDFFVPGAGDHPRVCGEKENAECHVICGLGSPPRMRGKGPRGGNMRATFRITPAYAGKSVKQVEYTLLVRDHPRVCGEKLSGCVWLQVYAGSPPRMRGKDFPPLGGVEKRGITPAYAGKSSCLLIKASRTRDHPRVCGEKFDALPLEVKKAGSPPRMRGKVEVYSCTGIQPGITPAYAGKSEGSFTIFQDR